MIKIKDTQKLYSGTVEFKDLTFETYRALIDLVSKSRKEDPVEGDTVSEPVISEEKPVGVNKDESKGKRGSKAVPETTKDTKPTNFSGIVDALKELIRTAKENPDKYEFRYVLAKEFIAENEKVFGGMTASAFGRAATLAGIPESKHIYVKGSGYLPRREYPMLKKEPVKEIKSPKPKDGNGVTGLSGWNYKQAHILREFRLKNGLSIKELSDVTHYPFYAVQGWESGTMAPSSEAIAVLGRSLGNDFKNSLILARSC